MRLDERGLTLAEILVAVFVVGVGLVGLLFVIPVATYGVQEGSQLSTATFLAEQRLEQVRHAVWATLPDPGNTGQGTDCLGIGSAAAPTSVTCDRPAPTVCTRNALCTTFPDEPAVTGYPSYSRTVRVEDCSVVGCGGINDGNLRLVTVSVAYTPLTGAGVSITPKSIQLRMLIARRQ